MPELRSVKILFYTCSYLDVLDKISPISTVFEGNDLLPCEIQPSPLILEGLDELSEVKEVDDVPIDTDLSFFSGEVNNKEVDASISREYKKAGHQK